ncbi:MAG: polyprenyl synthetase family protein [bacterium]|nr:polyprenyl synthetase family protein [bacterium]
MTPLLVAELAQRYLPPLDAFMRDVVESAPTAPGFDTLLRYPFGWVDANGQPYHHPTGKRIRPILLLLCAEAAGGDWHSALPAAAAVEILHNFSLIHDDIQDDSEIRHNRPTVWKIWGRANAINAGDAIFALAYSALSRLNATTSPEIALACWQIFNLTNLELTRGQHLDMRFESQASVTTDAYISMVSGKTAALVSASAQMGALIASGSTEKAAHFARYGLNLGIAFQIHDDILGIWGNPDVTGKSAATDILSRKKSLPVLYGLAQSPTLNAVYQRNPFQAADVDEAVRLLDTIGAHEYTRQSEAAYFQQALDALHAALNGRSQAANDLLRLSDLLFERSF